MPEDPFDRLRARLLTAHQLTDIQRVEKLLALPPLGKQKPSELLEEMMRICPRGEENSVFFNCHFLQKLPRELRVLLSEADMSDKRLLSARADQIWAHHVQLQHDTVASVDHAAHQAHLRQLLAALQRHCLVINAEKCVWGVESIDFLGHCVSSSGVEPLPSHVAAVQEFPRPETVKELQAFLGMVNFY